MDEKTAADVILGPDDADDVAVDIALDETEDVSTEEKTSDTPDETKSEDKKADKADKDEDEVDFESVLLAEDDKSEADKDTKEESKTETPSNLSDSLKTLKELAEQLDNLPENQDANFNKLRKMNRELIKGEITKLEAAERVASFGDLDKVEEGLTLLDDLDGYDHEIGQPSTKAFADKLVAKDPEKGYNLALNLMLGKTKDGREFAEVFTRRVLGLDPDRLKDFQAISKGEVPEGYEGMIAVTKDLERVDPQFHDAFKRLTPKQREIVAEGLDQYATQGEKIEALQILQESQKVLESNRKDQADQAEKTETLQNNIVTKAMEFEATATESIGTKLTNGLEKVVFSSDQTIDLTMKQAVETRLFDLVHESAYVRGRAEAYFKKMGIELDRKKLDYHYNRLSDNIDIEAVATSKGQKDAATKAHNARVEAEKQIAAIGLGLIARIARKAGGKLASQAAEKTKVPKNNLPATKRQDSSAGNGSKPLTWKEAAAATRAGKSIGAGN